MATTQNKPNRYYNPFVTTGGTYENPRLGITDYSRMSTEIETGLEAAVERKKKREDEWKLKYDAGTLAAEELYSGELIGGTDDINITDGGIALESQQNTADMFQQEMVKKKKEFAYATASGDVNTANAILGENKVYQAGFNGANNFTKTINDVGPGATYSRGASDRSFDNGVSYDWFINYSNKNKDKLKLVTREVEGVTVAGFEVDYPNDLQDPSKGTSKKFIDFSKWNDPDYVATKMNVNFDKSKHFTTTQNKDNNSAWDIEYENIVDSTTLLKGDKGYEDAIVGEGGVEWVDPNDESKGKKLSVKTQRMSDKTIGTVRSLVDQDTSKFMLDETNKPDFYNQMINSSYTPGDAPANTIDGAITVEQNIYKYLQQNQSRLGIMTKDANDGYTDLLVQNGVLPSYSEWSAGKSGNEIDKKSDYRELVEKKKKEINDWFISDAYKQEALANTQAFDLDQNGRAVEVGTITEKSQDIITTSGTNINVNVGGSDADPITTADLNAVLQPLSEFVANVPGQNQFLGLLQGNLEGIDPATYGEGTYIDYQGVDLNDPNAVKALGNSMNQMFGNQDGQLVSKDVAFEYYKDIWVNDETWNAEKLSWEDLPEDKKFELEGKFNRQAKLKLRPDSELIYVSGLEKDAPSFIPMDNLSTGDGYFEDIVNFLTLPLSSTNAQQKKYKDALLSNYRGSPLEKRDKRVKGAVNLSKGAKFDDIKNVQEFYTVNGSFNKEAFKKELGTINVLRSRKGLPIIGLPANFDEL